MFWGLTCCILLEKFLRRCLATRRLCERHVVGMGKRFDSGLTFAGKSLGAVLRSADVVNGNCDFGDRIGNFHTACHASSVLPNIFDIPRA